MATVVSNNPNTANNDNPSVLSTTPSDSSCVKTKEEFLMSWVIPIQMKTTFYRSIQFSILLLLLNYTLPEEMEISKYGKPIIYKNIHWIHIGLISGLLGFR